MSSPKLSLHQCLKDIALCERKRKMTTHVASFMRLCALAHLSDDPDEAAAAMETLVSRAVDSIPDVEMSDIDIADFSASLRRSATTCQTNACSSNVPTNKRSAATSFVAVSCSDEDDSEARAPQSAGTVD